MLLAVVKVFIATDARGKQALHQSAMTVSAADEHHTARARGPARARAVASAEEAKLLAAYRRSSAWHRTVLLGLAIAFGSAEEDPRAAGRQRRTDPPHLLSRP
jgi:hypothetical protein